MRLLEYEAKTILKTFSLPIPRGEVIQRGHLLATMTPPIVLKSQVPVGGRGKLGGIKIIDNKTTLTSATKALFSLNIKGYIPTALLAEEKIAIKHEHYLSLLIDRDTASIHILAHKDGGVEVEDNSADDFLNLVIDAETVADCTHKVAAYFGYPLSLIEPLVTHLFVAFTESDATLLEINPLIYTADNRLVCGDCKMELDDAAGFRHPEWDFEDKPKDTNFVTLDPEGTIATIANGAGLAMATVDAVAASGMKPANFLDIGGGANAESVLKAFKKITTFSNVQAIVINIFAGITRCDEVAKAVIEAKTQINSLPPLFIRLAGTNFEAAVELLSQENIPTLATLEECLEAARSSHS